MIVGPSGTPDGSKTRPLRKRRESKYKSFGASLAERWSVVVGRQRRYRNSRLPQKIWRGNNSDSENPAAMWIQLIQGRNVSDPR
jgi:hypothetical protein